MANHQVVLAKVRAAEDRIVLRQARAKLASIINMDEVSGALEKGGNAVADFLDAPSTAQLANADLQGSVAAVRGAGGNLPGHIRLEPQVGNYGWTDRLSRLMENPKNQTRALMIGGGAVAGSLLTNMYRKRKEEQRRAAARQELERLGLKTASIKEMFESAKQSLSDMYSGGQSLQSLGAAKEAVAGKFSEWGDIIRDGLDNPKLRPYVASALGAALGGGSMAAMEMLRGKKRRRLLNAFATGAAGGGLAGYGYGALTNPQSSKIPSGAGKGFLRSLDRKAAEDDPTYIGQAAQGVGSAVAEAAQLSPTGFGATVGAGAGHVGGKIKDAYDYGKYRDMVHAGRNDLLNADTSNMHDAARAQLNKQIDRFDKEVEGFADKGAQSRWIKQQPGYSGVRRFGRRVVVPGAAGGVLGGLAGYTLPGLQAVANDIFNPVISN
jgi:uncharacterized membrane protein YebE (DUF533 family)